MKRKFFTVFMAVALGAFFTVSCGSKNDKAEKSETEEIVDEESEEDAEESQMAFIEEKIAENNKSMPMQVAEGMTIAKTVLEDGNMVTCIEASDAIFQGVVAKGEEGNRQEGMASMQNTPMDPLTKAMVEEGIGMISRYTNVETGDVFEFGFTSEELEQCYKK